MIIGVTGHQNIGQQETVAWVESTLRGLVKDASPELGITCLARGADQLYAQVLLDHNIPYIAIIASEDYDTTFDDSQAFENYRRLLGKAVKVVVLNNTEASEQAFFDAGKALVDKSDYMFAVWDGQPAKGLGGTADVVRYALDSGKKVVHLNTKTHLVSKLP